MPPALDQGFFAEEGLPDVELIALPEGTGELLDREAQQVELTSGAVDIGIDPRTTFVLEARDRGEPACIVAARRKNHAFVLFGQRDQTISKSFAARRSLSISPVGPRTSCSSRS